MTIASSWRIAPSVAGLSWAGSGQRTVLSLHRPALAGEGPAGKALNDETVRFRRYRGTHQISRAFGPQAVRHGEFPVDIPNARRWGDGRHFVHDHVGRCAGDRRGYCLGIESIRDNRISADRADGLGLASRARHSVDRVAGGQQDG